MQISFDQFDGCEHTFVITYHDVPRHVVLEQYGSAHERVGLRLLT